MNSIKPIILPLIFLLLFFCSCRDDMQVNKYERPDWLAGKLYDQILEQPDISTFAKCIKLTRYDSIINISGCYTVFAPSNLAIETWLDQKTNYNSVEAIPMDELTRLVKYHIVQNPWTKAQLRTLDVYGWIDTLDVKNDKAKGFKRETLLKELNRKFGWTQLYDGQILLADTLNTPLHRRVITDSRKFVPLFYQDYFNIFELVPGDYQFYFNRPFEGGSNIFFCNGKIISDEIFSENGFIYIIDQVVEPLRNAYVMLESGSGNADYSHYLDLIDNFPRFSYNQDMTFKQEGADRGIAVDSLFDLTFPQLTFNVTGERTQPPTGTYGLPRDVTIRYHHGLMAPTNAAFDELINTYIEIPGGWGNLAGAPQHIRRIIANTHMSINPVYPSDFTKGFYNGELDIVKINPDNIIQKEFGSNCTFLGLDKAIVPRAFSSVTGAVYLRQGFAKIMYAIEQADLLPLLKRQNKDYMFFVEPDWKTSLDSSLIYDPIKKKFSVFQVPEEGSIFIQKQLNFNDLRTLLLNHIGVQTPKGIARKEFIINLAGNYLIVNNETGEVSGTLGTTEGYNGTTLAPEFPVVISVADNGKTYSIKNWFSFGSPTIYTRISTQFPAFHALMKKAGYALDKESRYSFISNSELYTAFVPNQAAIESSGLNNLPVEELRKALMMHFVRGELIFTDGNAKAGYFETGRIDDKSTQYSTIYSKVYIEPGIDVIRFRGKGGGIFAEISESGVTNMLTGVNLGTGEEVFNNTFNNSVVHEINKVLIYEDLDTR